MYSGSSRVWVQAQMRPGDHILFHRSPGHRARFSPRWQSAKRRFPLLPITRSAIATVHGPWPRTMFIPIARVWAPN